MLPISADAASARINPRPTARLREVGPAKANPPGQARRARYRLSTQIGRQPSLPLREVGPAEVNSPGQALLDRLPRSIQIGPQPPLLLRELGPDKVNPPGQACRDPHSPSTRITGCRIPETLDLVIPRSAIPRSPIHEPGRTLLCLEVHDSPAHITLTCVNLPLVENPGSVEAIFRSSRTYLAWR